MRRVLIVVGAVLLSLSGAACEKDIHEVRAPQSSAPSK